MSTVDISPTAVAADAERYRTAYAGHKEHFSWASPASLFAIHDCERHTLELLKRYRHLPLAEKSILEVGCGTGAWLRHFVRWGARPENLAGVDLLAEDLARARLRLPAGVRLEVGSAAELRFPAASFDLALQATCFTSILDPELRRRTASEMLRVVKPDGLILWYDFHVNNPWNPDVRRVTKREIHELFPHCRIDLQRVTLAPPLARWVVPRSWLLAYLLNCVPLLRTHYLGAITKRNGAKADIVGP